MKLLNLEGKFLFLLLLWLLFHSLNHVFSAEAWWWEPISMLPSYVFPLAVFALSINSLRMKNIKLFLVGFLFFGLFLFNPLDRGSLRLDRGHYHATYMSNEKIRIVSLNVFKWNRGQDVMLEYLREQKADIYLLQEASELEGGFFEVFGFGSLDNKLDGNKTLSELLKIKFSRYTLAKHGELLIISKYPITGLERGDGFLKARVLIGEKQVDVWNVHLQVPMSPQKGFRRSFEKRKEQFRELKKSISNSANLKLIAGDFNTKENSRFLDFLFEGFQDAGSNKLGFPITYTVVPLFRVDYIFLDKYTRLLSYSAEMTFLSDHYLVIAEVAL